ncbi:unnamed protein product [Cladocopium goreaui]|uniref:Uncharacterized protein n=1 Tax=Cladocopium goreaui TaxID=2562237 RepID=A0A9P1CXU4_9DINO|nr:unnamed protein product [Cladocopium goreaui]
MPMDIPIIREGDHSEPLPAPAAPKKKPGARSKALKQKQQNISDYKIICGPKGKGKEFSKDLQEIEYEFFGTMDPYLRPMRFTNFKKYKLIQMNFIRSMMLEKGWHVRRKINGACPQWVKRC